MTAPGVIDDFLGWVAQTYLPSCRDDEGGYGRQPGHTSNHAYGTAEAVNLAHSLGVELGPLDDLERAFAALQHPTDGHFIEDPPTHHRVHATAYNRAAMELLGLRPRVAIALLDQLHDSMTASRLVDGLDWRDDVYIGSHEGAGVAALVALDATGEADAWFDAYFSALEDRLDERNGMFGVDKPPSGDSDQVGGTFHYAFLYEHFGRPLPHPEARIDAVLGLRQQDGWWHPDNHLWLTLDAVYLLTRAARATDHRRPELNDVVEETCDLLADTYATAAGRRHFEEWYLGAHDLTAVVSTFAEIQAFSGGALGPDPAVWPLRLVLDSRPFI